MAAKCRLALWLALAIAIAALSSCSVYVTPNSDEDATLKDLTRKSL